jgi:hypothetical protein
MRRAALAALAVLASAGTAVAFVRTTTDKGAAVRWPRACVVVIAHTANPPPNLTPDLVVSAARAAAASWSRQNVSCTGFELQVATMDTKDAPVANDKTNNMVFRTDKWEYEPSALAITTVFAQQNNGTILDADVELNAIEGGRFKWGDLVAGIGVGTHVEDLQNTLTHEFGHLLGLDHNCFLQGTSRHNVDHTGTPVPDCDRSTPEVQEATMFAAVTPGDTLRRTLAADDIAGVCAIYPPESATSCSAGGGNGGGDLADGGCSYGRGRVATGGGLLLASALLWFSALRRRGRRPGA